MKLYSYIIKHDIGLAPNPFWGYCTLALCTPNHMGIKPQNGDWIIGTTPMSLGSKLVYAMQVSETLSFEEYYADKRFEKKKPNVTGSWKEKCGDNMYYKDGQGQWAQHPTIHHNEPELKKKDLRHPTVFIAEEKFYYFGDTAPKLPSELQLLELKRQGCKANFERDDVERFLNWLKGNFKIGVIGKPKDNDECRSKNCN